MVAAVGVALISVALLRLIAIVLPNVLAIAALGLAVGLFGLLHYLVWGRWLTRKLRESEASAEEDTDEGD